MAAVKKWFCEFCKNSSGFDRVDPIVWPGMSDLTPRQETCCQFLVLTRWQRDKGRPASAVWAKRSSCRLPIVPLCDLVFLKLHASLQEHVQCALTRSSHWESVCFSWCSLPHAPLQYDTLTGFSSGKLLLFVPLPNRLFLCYVFVDKQRPLIPCSQHTSTLLVLSCQCGRGSMVVQTHQW